MIRNRLVALAVASIVLLSAGAPPASAAWWRPAVGDSWHIQLQGRLVTGYDVDLYDIDLFDTPTSTIAAFHRQGRRVVCYVSAGSYEQWRPDAARFPRAVLGRPLDGWPGERWLDVRAPALRPIMLARFDLAVSKGCDAVDPDNVDGYRNASGFPLTGAHQLAYNRFLAVEAHRRGLAIGLKNDLDQIPSLVGLYDFAVNEECFLYDECDRLKPFIDAGKPVFQIEYGAAGLATRICPRANALEFETLIKDLNLGPRRTACRT